MTDLRQHSASRSIHLSREKAHNFQCDRGYRSFIATKLLSALGVASTVVQFVDFSSKLIHRGYNICRSDYGDLLNKDRKIIAEHLNILTTELEGSLQVGRFGHELYQLSRECKRLEAKLLQAVRKLKTSHKRHTWNSFLEALSILWNEKHILETYEHVQ